MTDAVLGFVIKSDQAKQAAGDLEKMTAASNAAEAAQQKLAGASVGANAALAKIAAGVDTANAALAKLVQLTETNSAATGKLDVARQAVVKTTGQEARASETNTAAIKQETAATDQLTAALLRHNQAEARYIARDASRRASGLDVWGRSRDEVAALALQPKSPVATAIPMSATAQADINRANAITKSAADGALATRMLTSELAAALIPANALSFAIFSLGSAAAEWAKDMLTGASQTEKALERHKQLIDDIAKAYPAAADAAKKYQDYAERLPKSEVDAGLRTDTKDLTKQSVSAVQSLVDNLSVASASSEVFGEEAAKKFGDLAERLKSGAIEAYDLRDEIAKISLDPNLIGVAKELVKTLSDGAKELARIQGGIDAAEAARRTFIGGPEDARNAGAANRRKYDVSNAEALYRLQREREAALGQIGARSPGALADAARAREALRPVDGAESPEVRKFREESAAALAYAQALHQITQAQEQRIRSMRQSLDAQQLDIDLVGKTGSEAARARYEFENLARVREIAAQNGIKGEAEFQKLFGAEVDLIKQAADEAGRYADALARAKFANDLAFDHDQLRRTTNDAAIAAAQRGAGLPIDMDSPEAKAMRANLEFGQAKDIAKGFLATFESTLVSSGGNIGKSLGAAILSALTNSMNKQFEELFDKLATSFASWILGGSSSGAGGLGSLLGGGALTAGGLLSANDNYSAGAVTRTALGSPATGSGSAMGMVGNYRSGVDARLTDILSTAAERFGGYKVDAFSGFRAGDPRFHGKGLATDVRLTDLASGKTLGNYQDPSTFRAYEQFAQTARQVQLEKYPELADQFRWGGYFGGPRGKYGAMDQMHFDLGGKRLGMAGGSWESGLTAAQRSMFPGVESFGLGASKASMALDKLAASSATTAKDLTSGLGKLGSSLTQAVGTQAGEGGGLFDTLFSFLPKLLGFADGTEGAPPGWAWVGERGPELRKLRAGDVIRSNPRSMQMMSDNTNGGGMSTYAPVFNIDARGSTISRAEFEQIADRQARAALSEYQGSQVRGGLGGVQRQFASYKG